MRILISGFAALALAACSEGGLDGEEDGVAEIKVDEDNVAIGDEPITSDPRFADTAWEWKANDGTPLYTVLYASGVYHTAGSDVLRDEGRWTVRDDHLCFDSEMLKDEPGCFSADAYRPLDLGQVWLTDNHEGEAVRFTRAEYRQLAFEAPGT